MWLYTFTTNHYGSDILCSFLGLWNPRFQQCWWAATFPQIDTFVIASSNMMHFQSCSSLCGRRLGQKHHPPHSKVIFGDQSSDNLLAVSTYVKKIVLLTSTCIVFDLTQDGKIACPTTYLQTLYSMHTNCILGKCSYTTYTRRVLSFSSWLQLPPPTRQSSDLGFPLLSQQ